MCYVPVDTNKIIIIFSGYNDRAVISFIRELENNGLDYVIIAKNKSDLIFKTIYKDNIVLTRESQKLDLDLIKNTIEIIQLKFKAEKYFIAPSTEALNRFLQKERAALSKMDVIVPLSSAAIYESVSDKSAFGTICEKNGILVPSEYESIATTSFPFVAKPKTYYSIDGTIYSPFLIFNDEQKRSFLDECDSDDFYYQEYVQGRSIYLLYYFHRNGAMFKFSQENLVQQPEGKSMIAAISSDFHNTNESTKYERLFTSIGFHGLVMVEIKSGNGKNYMIEANPRIWGPSQLFIDADVNFFEAFLHDYGFIVNLPIFNSHSDKTKYFWFGGMQSVFRDQKKLSILKGQEQDYLMDLDFWISHDVYKRADTIELFKQEIM